MSRDWLLYVDDIIGSAEKIGRMTKHHSYETFIADEAVFDAVLFNLQIIGEAVKNLPDTARTSLPDVDWTGPARLRDFIAHHYFSVDTGIIWDAATNHVPAILEAARTLVTRFDTQ